MNQYKLFKPRKEKNGMAAQFDVADNGVFLTLAKQKPSTGENDSFEWVKADGKKNIIKLDLPDIGALLAMFEGNTKETKLYHEFEKEGKKVITNLNASFYAPNGDAKGYVINIIRDGDKFGFSVSFSEAEVLKVLLRSGIMNLTKVEFKK